MSDARIRDIAPITIKLGLEYFTTYCWNMAYWRKMKGLQQINVTPYGAITSTISYYFGGRVADYRDGRRSSHLVFNNGQENQVSAALFQELGYWRKKSSRWVFRLGFVDSLAAAQTCIHAVFITYLLLVLLFKLPPMLSNASCALKNLSFLRLATYLSIFASFLDIIS